MRRADARRTEYLAYYRNYPPRIVLGVANDWAGAAFTRQLWEIPEPMTFWVDETNGWSRRRRRNAGYNPETDARTAMHAAYRGKTRRRGKR